MNLLFCFSRWSATELVLLSRVLSHVMAQPQICLQSSSEPGQLNRGKARMQMFEPLWGQKTPHCVNIVLFRILLKLESQKVTVTTVFIIIKCSVTGVLVTNKQGILHNYGFNVVSFSIGLPWSACLSLFGQDTEPQTAPVVCWTAPCMAATTISVCMYELL